MADNNFLSSLLNYGQSFAQGASNSIAGNVSAPIDGMAWLLRRAGVPMSSNPVGGSDWMNQQGLTPQPQVPLAGMLGEAAGMAGPMVAAAKAPQIAKGLLQMGENAMVPRTMNPQTGAIAFGKTAENFGSNDDLLREIYSSGKNADMQLTKYPDGRRFVNSAYVDPLMRGNGIGQDMYRAALQDGPITVRNEFMSSDAKRVYEALLRKGIASVDNGSLRLIDK